MKEARITGSILVTETIGLSALEQLLKRKGGEIKEKFPAFFVQEAVNLVERRQPVSLPLWIKDERMTLELGEGGLLNGLWNLCEALDTGCAIELRRIPIRQELIEICEIYDLNPLYLYSKGTYLIASEHGFETWWKLKEAGIESHILGVTTTGADRRILSGEQLEHVRFLDRPQKEELLKYFSSAENGCNEGTDCP